jgi:hypothetical protein
VRSRSEQVGDGQPLMDRGCDGVAALGDLRVGVAEQLRAEQ